MQTRTPRGKDCESGRTSTYQYHQASICMDIAVPVRRRREGIILNPSPALRRTPTTTMPLGNLLARGMNRPANIITFNNWVRRPQFSFVCFACLLLTGTRVGTFPLNGRAEEASRPRIRSSWRGWQIFAARAATNDARAREFPIQYSPSILTSALS